MAAIVGRYDLLPLERFNAQVLKTDSCWLWQGTKTKPNGYGRFRIDGKKTLAHRWAYEFFKGPIPAGLLVCHTCDVRACVNPKHLWIGTLSDNGRDSVEKGRAYFQRMPNEERIKGASKRAGDNHYMRRRK